MDYKLILTDLDATLLNDKKEVSEEDKKYMKKAFEMGVNTVICSGRSYMSLRKFVESLELNKKGNYGIGYNGGIIYEADTEKVIIENLLDKKYAMEVIKLCKEFKPNAGIVAYCNGELIAEEENQMVKEYAELSGIKPVIVNSFNEYINYDVSKVLLRGENSELLRVLEFLKTKDISNYINMFFSSEILFEITKKEVNKGEALKQLAEYLDLNKSQVIAMGDNYNDIDMIREAGLGVAVANAVDDAKKAADYITKSTNNESAFSEVVKKFITEEL